MAVERGLQTVDASLRSGIRRCAFEQGERLVIAGEQRPLGAEPERDGFVDAVPRFEHRLLLEKRDARCGREPALAVVEHGRARQHPQQRRLAGTVAADQPDVLAGLELKVGAVEQRHVAERETRACKGQHRHAHLFAAGIAFSPPCDGHGATRRGRFSVEW